MNPKNNKKSEKMKFNNSSIKHIVCYSGGHSSALTAIEVCRKYGKNNVILLNHDINPAFEDKDIKRFKNDVADYLGIKITYANVKGIINPEKIPNQFEVCEEKGTFVNPANRQILCTFILKTEPFNEYLKSLENENICAYYGFDNNELNRVERRKTILNDMNVNSDYPLALWGMEAFESLKDYLKTKKINPEAVLKIEQYIDTSNYERTIHSTNEIGIRPPNTYSVWKHANCKGCLKAGKQHWYCVYVHENWIFERAKLAEKRIGYSFGKEFLKDLEPTFKKMKEIGIPANENISSNQFWKSAKKYLKSDTIDLFPCQCFL